MIFFKRSTISSALIFMAVGLPHMAQAEAGLSGNMFSCSLGKKSVWLTSNDKEITYHFGTHQNVEKTIVGSEARKNLFYRSDRYTGMEYQLRFTDGQYSYIVYNLEGNGQTGASAAAGLVVMQGKKRIADMSCSQYAEFRSTFDLSELPEDDQVYSAM